MLSNGMVIQRNKPYPIRGNSEPHANVSASFRDTLYQAKADAQGDWTITLPSFPAGGPYELTIVEAKTTVISDILIGDVWILGGQSNMELPIKRTLDRHQKDIENHHYPSIRQFNVPQVYDFSGPCSTIIKGDWIQATGEAIDHFSAVGYFFALAISQSENVPIGLILTAVGGTPAHAWVSETSYHQILPDAAELAEVQHPLHVQATIAADSKRIDQWHHKLNATDPGLKKPVWYQQTEWTKQWTSIQLPTRFTESLLNYRGSIWFRKEFHLYSEQAAATSSLLKLGTIVDADETYLNGELVGQTGYKYPPRRYSIRSNLLKPGKNVLIVRVICKESTGGFVTNMPYELNLLDQSIDLSGEWHYRVGAQLEPLQPQTFFQTKPTGLYNGMIAPLKQHPITGFLWYQGESDTQAPAHYEEMFQAVINDWRTLFQQGDLPFLFVQLANFKADTAEENWPIIREKQRRILNTTGTAMAVTVDVGEENDLHPQNKKAVGERLALCAKHYAYGKSLVFSGPAFSHVERTGAVLIVSFTEVGGGLISRNSVLTGFSLCGEDGVFHPAHASIHGDTVHVRHPRIQVPLHARYGWSANPSDASLYNKEGLPAAPFTTEDSI